MNKVLLSFLLCLLTQTSFAQIVNFHLSPTTGTFISDEGKDYVIVHYEGKTANQIFQMLNSNAMNVYPDINAVAATLGNSLIRINSFMDDIAYIGKRKLYYGGKYQLLFEIKDGRIKVSAPVINEVFPWQKFERRYLESHYNLSEVVKGFCKDGQFQEKRLENVKYIEDNMNNLINSIIKVNEEKRDDSW